MALNPEYCLLGVVLNNPKLFELIKGNIFLNAKCNELYNVISAEVKRSKGFTKETILNLLKDNVKLKESDFYEIYDSAYFQDDFDKYYNHVLSSWGMMKTDNLIKELRLKKYTSITEIKTELQQIVLELSIDDDSEIKSSKDIIFNIISNLSQNKVPELILSHCSYIDNFGGYEKGDLVILAARPGVGKSSQMYNLILRDMRNDVPCGLFSLEAKEEKI
jgi:replicative DNA helicase